MTADDAQKVAMRLKNLRALQGNPEWQVIESRIKEAYKTHLAGCTDRGKTPEQRAEHLEAFHLAAEMDGLVERCIRELSDALQQYTRERDQVQSTVLEALN